MKLGYLLRTLGRLKANEYGDKLFGNFFIVYLETCDFVHDLLGYAINMLAFCLDYIYMGYDDFANLGFGESM